MDECDLYELSVGFETMTTTWTCQDGHEEHMTEDLGDLADREQVMRVEDDIYCGGCRRTANGERCGKRVMCREVFK
jgi:hypothetical protein